LSETGFFSTNDGRPPFPLPFVHVRKEIAMRPRTYYRGPGAVVTERHFVWLTSPTREFAVRDLRNIGFARAQTDGVRRYAALGVAGVLVLAATAWLVLGRQPMYAAGLLTIAVPVCFAASFRLAPSRHWVLSATYRGRSVILYTSSDTRVFNQVLRALRRAVEDARAADKEADLAS
jgi:hypothetical protein